jgi:hypothetical protein
MSRNAIKKTLLAEDNPGDARLLREMLNEQGLHRTEVTRVVQLGDAEKYLVDHRLTFFCSTGLAQCPGIGSPAEGSRLRSPWLRSELPLTTAMVRTSTYKVVWALSSPVSTTQLRNG